jgi:uncharacterized oxidoreductase
VSPDGDRSGGEVRIAADALRGLVADIFATAGCARDEAARIGHYLVEANLTGHDSHGVVRVPRYVTQLRDGGVYAGREVTVLMDTPAMALLDGNYGFGQTIGPQAASIGIEKAQANGVAVIGLRHSGHLGRIGDFAEMAAAAGLISLHFVNVAGSLLVAPFGAVDRRMSTNPIAIGVPRPDAPPLILDFATSRVAEGKVLVAAKGGKPLPPDALIDADGNLSGDPQVLYGASDVTRTLDNRNGPGSLRAMGEHKGFGLSFMCEVLAGALTGSGCAGPGERKLANGMLSIYLRGDRLDQDAGFAAELGQYIAFLRSAKPAAPGGEVLLPGEPERRQREARGRDGVPLAADTWQSIVDVAVELGVSPPAPLS